MELMQAIALYIPGLFIVGALLFVFGLGVRLLAETRRSKDRGNTVMRYGVLAMLLALALWAILWFMEAWESGVIEAWIDSFQ